MENSRVQSAFYVSLFGAVLLLNILIFKRFFTVLLIALTLAVLFHPVYKKILEYLKSEMLSAILTTIVVFLIVMLPLSVYAQKIIMEARHIYISTASGDGNSFVNVVSSKINGLNNPALSSNINQYLKNVADSLVNNIGSIFSSLAHLIFTFILVLFSLFFFLKNGTRIRDIVYEISPLPREADEKVLNKMSAAINSTLRGQMLVAIMQGIVGIIGFSIFGVPNPILWGSTILIAAFVPTVGTALVNVPVILYLYFSGQTFAALGLLIWELTAVTIIDNFIGPMVINQSLKLHPFIILLSIIGAIAAYGPIGFILGPLIVTMLMALFEIRYLLIKK